MKLKYCFEVMEMDDQIIAVPVGDNSSSLKGIIKLNKSAAAIIELLKEEITEEEIISILLSKYDGDEQQIKEYVHEFIEGLKDKDIVE